MSNFGSALAAGAAALLWIAIADTTASSEPANPAGEYRFKEPEPATYRVEATFLTKSQSISSPGDWLDVRRTDGHDGRMRLGARVVLQIKAGSDPAKLLAAHPSIRVDRQLDDGLFILQAPDARAAAEVATALSASSAVEVAHPVRRRSVALHGGITPPPNDPLFAAQWHLDHRVPDTGARLGPDLNARAAWRFTQGEGVVVALGDDGLDTGHRDFKFNLSTNDHFNFANDLASGEHLSSFQKHGTAVAGLIGARGGNWRGVAGVAPKVKLASWVIFDSFDSLVDEERVMDMFQYRSNVVSVQNHSWGNSDVPQLPMGVLELRGLSNAVAKGRGGRGVIMVRSGGNYRTDLSDGNDDGYAQDPRVIAVGAVRNTGRAASYSNPGANLLVGAFAGDEDVDVPGGSKTNYPGVVTTDRSGAQGYNRDPSEAGDYATGGSAFTGTSAAAPQISGLAALMLSANPQLTYRDVQQILVLSARQTDPADPDIQTNGAGLKVSHNVGFGVPDAGLAVQWARQWSPRPPMLQSITTRPVGEFLPDAGLRLRISGDNLPATLASIIATPTDGLHPDNPTAAVPLVDVGQALAPIQQDLTGKAALIRRGGGYFVQKLQYAADAGATFAVMYNNSGGSEPFFINGADVQFSRLPAVAITQNDGEALAAFLAEHPEAKAQLFLDKLTVPLWVSDTLQCEHVALKARFNHPRRADVRLTLVSPSGTRSVLHHYNKDTTSTLTTWTFYSTHHFFETSAGLWTVEASDERPGSVGQLDSVELTINGVPITDSDMDGLDDAWEMAHFGTLLYGPQSDPDGDGWGNLHESLIGTDPMMVEATPVATASVFSERLLRLSWPSPPQRAYQVWSAETAAGPYQLLRSASGSFPETEVLLPSSESSAGFFLLKPDP